MKDVSAGRRNGPRDAGSTSQFPSWQDVRRSIVTYLSPGCRCLGDGFRVKVEGVKAKILVVDDEPDVLDLVTYNLGQAGFQTRPRRMARKRCARRVPPPRI